MPNQVQFDAGSLRAHSAPIWPQAAAGTKAMRCRVSPWRINHGLGFGVTVVGVGVD